MKKTLIILLVIMLFILFTLPATLGAEGVQSNGEDNPNPGIESPNELSDGSNIDNLSDTTESTIPVDATAQASQDPNNVDNDLNDVSEEMDTMASKLNGEDNPNPGIESPNELSDGSNIDNLSDTTESTIPVDATAQATQDSNNEDNNLNDVSEKMDSMASKLNGEDNPNLGIESPTVINNASLTMAEDFETTMLGCNTKKGSITVKKIVQNVNGIEIDDNNTFQVKLQIKKTIFWIFTYWQDKETKDFSKGTPAVFENLDCDQTYKIIELDKQGYTAVSGNNTEIKLASGCGGCTKEVTITNKQIISGSITVKKIVQNVNGIEIDDNNTFQVKLQYNQNGIWTDKETKDFSKGTPAVFENLDCDQTYKIIELDKQGYTAVSGNNTEIKLGTGCGSCSKEITITNKQKPGTITLYKSFKEPLPTGSNAAGFTLYKEGDSSFAETQTITIDGSITWNNLEWGTYYIEESTVPAGYAQMTTIGNIVINGTNLNHDCGTVENTRLPGKITLTKTGLKGDVTANFKLGKVEGTGDNQTITYYGQDGKPVPAGYEGIDLANNGSATWEDLPWGTYKFEEIVPVGYTDCDNISDLITIDSSNAGTEITITCTNEQIKGEIKLTKEGLPAGESATFTLYNEQGTTPIAGLDPLILTSTNPTGSWTGLEWGTYTIKESGPAGYSPTFSGDIADDGKIIIGVDEEDNEHLKLSITCTNEQIKGEIKLTKEGLPAGESATFTLYNEQGTTPIAGLDPLILTSTNPTGSWTGLEWGTYTIKESGPAGYSPTFSGDIADDGKIIIGVDEEGNGHLKLSITCTNEQIKGEIKLTKNFVGATAPATFYLRGEDEKYYNQDGVAVSKTNAAVVFTTSGQTQIWKNLQWQNYFLEENPIANFVSNNNQALPITIDADNLEASRTVTNTYIPPSNPYSITINKTDNTGTIKLSGGVFQIKNADGIVIANVTSDANGVAFVSVPGGGTYTIEEITAPSGYMLNTNIFTVTLTSSSPAATVNITNDPAITVAGLAAAPGVIEVLGIQELPFTGQNIMLIIAGLALLVLAIILVITIKNKKASDTK